MLPPSSIPLCYIHKTSYISRSLTRDVDDHATAHARCLSKKCDANNEIIRWMPLLDWLCRWPCGRKLTGNINLAMTFLSSTFVKNVLCLWHLSTYLIFSRNAKHSGNMKCLCFHIRDIMQSKRRKYTATVIGRLFTSSILLRCTFLPDVRSS